jgi:hypothetical protein
VPDSLSVRDSDGDGLPTLSGVAEPGAIVTITGPSGAVVASVVADAVTGNFSTELSNAPVPLEGTYRFTARDAAGNTSAAGTFEASDLSAPVISSLTPSWGSNLNVAESAQAQTVSIVTSGAENGRTVSLSLNGQTYSATVSNNSATVTVPAAHLAQLLDAQSYTLSATVSDVLATPQPWSAPPPAWTKPPPPRPS